MDNLLARWFQLKYCHTAEISVRKEVVPANFGGNDFSFTSGTIEGLSLATGNVVVTSTNVG